ncbi:general substrate transporter [Diplodia corticola]|uniref:General substrate transporter n=1 Tax=Diplodia corticola TaxID=236234 RepID=A0A1J9RUI7_9PEZI|nr:general substrate transporter [Diplodia corticola]OJD31516.1 general substrate transporter [Diplodia corticola]
MHFEKPLLLKELTPRLVQVYLLVSLGAMNFGVDNNYWSAVVSMDKFAADLGTRVGGSTVNSIPSSWLSIASGTPIAGWVIGCVVASEITRRLGRRLTVVIICIIAIVGIIIQSAVSNYWAIMAGRLVNSVSMGIEANCIPMYMSELSPPAIRGAMVNFYQWWLMVGGLIAASTVYATSTWTSEWAWKTVIVVQIIIPVLLLTGIWFVPESPRWLLSQHRRADALAALAHIRHGSGATRSDVETELALLEAALAEQVAAHRATSWLDCVRRNSNGRRTFIAVGVQCLQQSQGAAFLNTYLVVFLKQIGLPDVLKINVAYMAANLAGATLAFYLTDKIGRRYMLMGASACMCVLLWVVSGLAAWYPSGVSGGAVAQGCIAAIMLHSIFSTGAWGSVTWTVTAEVATAQLRERTVALATASSFCCNLLITYVNPFLQLGNSSTSGLGPRVGIVYASVSAAAVVFVYLAVPEMRGRSLEELDELFQARGGRGVPAWRSAAFVGKGVGRRVTEVQNNRRRRTTTAYSEGVGRVGRVVVVDDSDVEGGGGGRESAKEEEVVAVEESPKGEKEEQV